ncbi:ABC transporter permease [Agrobacterium larrymoorei]|uniref:Octopine/nopaline transport system permease protein n=1 Tax=Agrobacterium larrymoorei TaxID=160699 RepID=A0ABU0UJ11_9HYPH|nr:ABC transporter permease [Agrobacterium larrymoorei]MDQ1184940.1 octopine/nopaline transport system permease protein [Agrobacterium larrymoorei]
MIDVGFFLEIIPKLLSGVPLTLQLAGSSLLLGFCLALMLALAQSGGHRLAVWPIRSFVAIFRGTPLLVQIFLIYYGLGQFRPSLQAAGLWWLFREPYWCAILALTLNTAAYGSEILRGAIRNVPRGLGEAALALGLSRWLSLRLVILPLAIRQAIPAYGNEIILMVKGTSLASIITLMEVTGIAQGLISQSYRAIEVFIAAGAIYLAMNFIIVRTLGLIENRLTPYRRRA